MQVVAVMMGLLRTAGIGIGIPTRTREQQLVVVGCAKAAAAPEQRNNNQAMHNRTFQPLMVQDEDENMLKYDSIRFDSSRYSIDSLCP